MTDTAKKEVEQLINSEEKPFDLFAETEKMEKPKPKFLQWIRNIRLKVTPFITGFIYKAFVKLTDVVILLILLKIYEVIIFKIHH